ncbi:hypothetical protein [Rhodopirellula halodulae]|uniref:hypothetical protein n=1 Tax=Rhodopirellula halodulae TaxID=2894198 RepID=UPI001E37752C|nr:hypothetical protein [Rhodopirellula sp. JC737]MCC9656721.1 hypothetical protein [Rhodopirellula sp. JC737]
MKNRKRDDANRRENTNGTEQPICDRSNILICVKGESIRGNNECEHERYKRTQQQKVGDPNRTTLFVHADDLSWGTPSITGQG